MMKRLLAAFLVSAVFVLTAGAQKNQTAVISVEIFTLGGGYLIEPVRYVLKPNQNAAQALLDVVGKAGYSAFYSGSENKDFYLAAIADGDKKELPSYTLHKTEKPEKININIDIPKYLKRYLNNNLSYFDANAYDKSKGTLVEFLFTEGTGWVYTLNNKCDSIPLSDVVLKNDDVLRVKFSLAFGADVGCADKAELYYKTADKDELTSFLADSSDLLSESQQAQAKKILQKLNASQIEVDKTLKNLKKAVNNTSSEIDPYYSSDILASAKQAVSKIAADNIEISDKEKLSSSKPQRKTQANSVESYTESLSSEPANSSSYSVKTAESDNKWYYIIILILLVLAIGAAAAYRKGKSNEKNN